MIHRNLPQISRKRRPSPRCRLFLSDPRSASSSRWCGEMTGDRACQSQGQFLGRILCGDSIISQKSQQQSKHRSESNGTTPVTEGCLQSHTLFHLTCSCSTPLWQHADRSRNAWQTSMQPLQQSTTGQSTDDIAEHLSVRMEV
jgi:hypothetical protein